MKVLDLEELEPEEGAEGAEVFYETEEFSVRVIKLPPGGNIPPHEMDTYVMFYVIEGKATVTVNNEETRLQGSMSLITEPATLSMETEEGVRMLGVQVAKS